MVKRIIIFISLFTIVTVKAQNDFEIAKNIDIFVSTLKELNSRYVDEILPGKLTKTAIDAMLSSLDPYTVYYPESQIEDVKIIRAGQYGGIGALIQSYGNGMVFSEIYENSPAAAAGINAGDKILKINNQSTSGKNADDVSAILKGEPGTSLSIEIERVVTNKKETVSITRAEIKFPNIPYWGMIAPNIGYIKLDQFIEKAGAEVKEAFLKLKEEGMKSLILDLRNNGGGLMLEAVKIMNIFVDKNVVITQTKGKIKEFNNSYRTQDPVIDKNIPVVVLVNEMSASASEIVAGSFQDLDRGVIVGGKTYGKGLVQNIVPLSYNSSMKITISKYYIPSGRCIQNIDYFSNDTVSGGHITIPDSLATPFKTKNGRTVYDKGGIEPDVVVKKENISSILISLIINNLIFDFANKYHADHPTLPQAKEFRITDDIYKEFVAFLKDKQYKYTTPAELAIQDFKEVAQAENHFEKVESIYNQLIDKLNSEKENDIYTFKKEISDFLAEEIVVRYYYQKGRIINALATDPDTLKAISILQNQSLYNSILSSKKK